MSRPKSSVFAFAVLSFTLLLALGLTAPNLAFAQQGGLHLSPTSLNFGNVVTGTTSPAQTVFATNSFKKFGVSFSSIVASAPFLKVGDTCDGSLGAGLTCHIDVACKPTAVGIVTGTLTFTFTAGDNGSATEIVPLTCTGVPAAGDVLISGGDRGGLLGGFIPLATSTNSTASSEIYNAITDAFSIVGPLVNSREATATAVVLPNKKTLIAGGSHCFAKTFGPGGACGASAFAGFECDALNTAELYNESTGAFTLAGSGSGGTMTTARSGATATLLANGTVLIAGGSKGSSFLSLGTPPPGCASAGQVSQNSAEIYNPVTDTFSATASIPGCPLGTGPGACGLPATCPGPLNPITSATEVGNVVTITTFFPNGLVVGEPINIAGVAVGGYNGTFLVSAILSATMFTYTDGTAGLAASGGGAAVPFRVCGLVDSVATLLNDTTALIAGGDYITFLGQSSPQAFIFVPVYAGGPAWVQTAPLNVPRELPGITKLPSGEVLVAGGLTSAAGACVSTPATPTAFTTNSSAETYDPVAHTWTLTGLMSVPRIASAELFTTGPDAGLAVLAGGVDAETTNGAGTNTFPTCEPVTNIAQTTQTATDLFNETTDTFTATGALNKDRAGYGSAILNTGPHSGDLVVIGGNCGNGTLASAAIGTATAGGLCDTGGTGFTDYYELFNPTTGAWTVGASPPASTPASAPASALLP